MSEIAPAGPDPEEAVGLLLRDLRATADGLSSAEADRRLLQYGANQLRRRAGPRWPAELAAQLTHPLALLLWVASGLSLAVGNVPVAVAVLLVIVLNPRTEAHRPSGDRRERTVNAVLER